MITNVEVAKENKISKKEFCNAIEIAERSFYYWKKLATTSDQIKRGRKSPPKNKLTKIERSEVVSVLLEQKWIDLSPREIYYKLLDEKKKIIASPATFYRVAKEDGLLTKRVKTTTRNLLNREKPSLLALGPNEIWSWDVAQIRSSIRNLRFYLYVIMDIWSRLVVGWKLEEHEKTEYAINMWKESLEQQLITGKGLINHKDNGAIMTSREMIKFVKDIEMVDSYSRAGVSDDNPFSEALFRTIKYFRNFPSSFDSTEEGRKYFSKYFYDYNYIHKHSGIQYLTPGQRHYGDEDNILTKRNDVISDFYDKNRHRYSRKKKIFLPIKEVRIN